MSKIITGFAESQAYARHHRDEDFWTPPPAAPAAAVPVAYDFHDAPQPQSIVVPFKPKGRHKFTREECQRGFWAAIESIVTRYPDAVMPDGRHIACNFLKHKNPQFFIDRSEQKRAA